MDKWLIYGKKLGKEYDFLKEMNIPEKTVLAVLAGSYSYGTNVETSDTDLRICVYNTPQELLGDVPKFETFQHDETDTVIHGFEKYVRLLKQCNPNVIENLGCRKEEYVYMSPAGQMLIDNSDMFLSKLAIAKFGGYADAQTNRMMNAVLEDKTEDDKEAAMAKSLDSLIKSFNYKYRNSDFSLNVSMCPTDIEDLSSEIIIQGYFGKLPLRKVRGMLSEIDNLLKIYNKMNHRNNKKTKEKLAKHMEHLIRLYISGSEIVTTGHIKTYVDGPEHDLLMRIRNGEFNPNEKTIYPEFFEIANDYQAKFEKAAKETVLPDEIDYERINEIVYKIQRDYLIQEGVL